MIEAVVDDRLKVKNIQGLRVADTSVMPSIIRGNTNAIAMAIGEKAADLIRDDWFNQNAINDFNYPAKKFERFYGWLPKGSISFGDGHYLILTYITA